MNASKLQHFCFHAKCRIDLSRGDLMLWKLCNFRDINENLFTNDSTFVDIEIAEQVVICNSPLIFTSLSCDIDKFYTELNKFSDRSYLYLEHMMFYQKFDVENPKYTITLLPMTKFKIGDTIYMSEHELQVELLDGYFNTHDMLLAMFENYCFYDKLEKSKWTSSNMPKRIIDPDYFVRLEYNFGIGI